MGENSGSCLIAPQLDEVWSQMGEKSGKSPLGDFSTSDEKAGLCSSLLPPSVASVMRTNGKSMELHVHRNVHVLVHTVHISTYLSVMSGVHGDISDSCMSSCSGVGLAESCWEVIRMSMWVSQYFNCMDTRIHSYSLLNSDLRANCYMYSLTVRVSARGPPHTHTHLSLWLSKELPPQRAVSHVPPLPLLQALSGCGFTVVRHHH